MKGVSTVVVTILLLLITIVIVGFAFGFFQRIFLASTTATSQEMESTTNRIQQRAVIDSIAGVSLTVRNSGSQSVPTSTLAVYVNGLPRSCDWGFKTNLGPSETASCTMASACTPGQAVRLTGPGGEDTVLCS